MSAADPQAIELLFREILAQSTAGDPDPAQTWAAFAESSNQPIDGLSAGDDEDRLLFEVFEMDSELEPDLPGVVLSFERQMFLHDPEGQYLGGQVLSYNVRFARTEVGDDCQDFQLWGRPGTDASQWISQVESHPAFAAIRDERPWLAVDIGAGPM